MLGYHLKKNVKPIVKHPFFAFIVFGLVLILLQILSWTAGFPKSSAMSGIATVLIYSIVGFGFTYLLGYAGLASLGTAGFTGLGAYIVGYFLRETGVPYIVSILVVLAVSIILGVAVGFISLRIEDSLQSLLSVFRKYFTRFLPTGSILREVRTAARLPYRFFRNGLDSVRRRQKERCLSYWLL